MKYFLGLIIGLAIAAGVVWFYADRGNLTARDAKDKVQAVAKEAETAIQDKLGSPEDIKAELARTGRVIRRKAQETGAAIADATADARTTAAIKAKFLTDPELPALSISVNTTAGRVTLSGTAASPELIRKAMQLALATDGVQEVISTLQVK